MQEKRNIVILTNLHVIDVAFITIITHVSSMRKENNIICNKDISTNKILCLISLKAVL